MNLVSVEHTHTLHLLSTQRQHLTQSGKVTKLIFKKWFPLTTSRTQSGIWVYRLKHIHYNTKHRIITKRRTARRAMTTWRTVHWNEFQHWRTHAQSLGPRCSPEDKHTWRDTSGELTKYIYGRKWIASHSRLVYRFQERRTVPNCWLHLSRFTPHFFHGVVAAYPSAPW